MSIFMVPWMIIVSLVIAFFVILVIHLVNAIFRKGSGSPYDSPNEETLLIQEIYEGLQRMEKRIEALETLLLDRVNERERV
jgi:phage shock protein B